MGGKSKQTTTNSQYDAAKASLGNRQYTPVTGEQIQSFQNPFTSSVIDTTLARAGQDQQMQLNQIGDGATRAGAFGGSRHGVAEGIARGQFDQNNQATMAGLNGAGYSQALQAALGQNAAQNQYPLAIQALLGQLAPQTTTGKAPTDWGGLFGGLGAGMSGISAIFGKKE